MTRPVTQTPFFGGTTNKEERPDGSDNRVTQTHTLTLQKPEVQLKEQIPLSMKGRRGVTRTLSDTGELTDTVFLPEPPNTSPPRLDTRERPCLFLSTRGVGMGEYQTVSMVVWSVNQ